MVNKVILVGNCGKDPDSRTLDNGTTVTKITLATSESYKDKEGNRQTKTEWHTIVFWRGLAEVVAKYVKKGSQLYIEGKITNRSYEKDGVTKYFTEIVANEMKMLGSKQSNETMQELPTGEANKETDDLPF